MTWETSEGTFLSNCGYQMCLPLSACILRRHSHCSHSFSFELRTYLTDILSYWLRDSNAGPVFKCRKAFSKSCYYIHQLISLLLHNAPDCFILIGQLHLFMLRCFNMDNILLCNLSLISFSLHWTQWINWKKLFNSLMFFKIVINTKYRVNWPV